MTVKGLYVLYIVNILLSSTSGDEIKRRPKRYLGFIDKSKYFLRLNSKHNMVPEFRIFAQATGFRINFETGTHAPGYKFGRIRHRLRKRDLYQNLEQLILQTGFDGRSCIQKAVCEAANIPQNKSGILIRLFKKIFSMEEEDLAEHPHLRLDQCDKIQGTCPLSFMHLSKYTDDI